MPAKTNQVGAAAQYARAMLELANEQQQAPAVSDDLLGIKEILQANPTFAAFLRDPGIAATERREVLDRLFKGHVQPLVMNFLGLLNAKNRLGILAVIADEYQEMLADQLGKIEVDLTVAHQLDGEVLEQVRQRINAAFKKDAVLHQHVDESIIGGLVLQIEDRVIDGSVKSQLDMMKKQLMAAAPR
jgi:F-type H+-transporting ATPase subunit delta